MWNSLGTISKTIPGWRGFGAISTPSVSTNSMDVESPNENVVLKGDEHSAIKSFTDEKHLYLQTHDGKQQRANYLGANTHVGERSYLAQTRGMSISTPINVIDRIAKRQDLVTKLYPHRKGAAKDKAIRDLHALKRPGRHLGNRDVDIALKEVYSTNQPVDESQLTEAQRNALMSDLNKLEEPPGKQKPGVALIKSLKRRKRSTHDKSRKKSKS